ncbi:Halomucin [Phytophthora citrophthora]|uniref:Halomucin n=1 Tax=Phytophthora citrophthora TaxID=4793 RepID=A0AAD9H0N8_9STRA|nr:Halomucin [Phytophthora citrophthora]
MPRAFTPSPDEAMAEPSAADIAAGIVSPMDIPIRTPIPILHIKTTEYTRKRHYNQSLRHVRKARRLDGIPDMQVNRFRQLQKYPRMRSSFQLPVSDWCTLSKDLQEMDEDFHVSKNYSIPCKCFSCGHLRRWSSTLQPYRCKASICDITFESFTDLFDHQLEVHGAVDPRSSRVINEVFHQQRGRLALPPATVYVGQQYMYPSRAPIPWKSIEELDAEAKVVHGKLKSYNHKCSHMLYRLFNIGYQLVKRTGWSEMERQYELAMEHFYSGMKYPATSRLTHDGCPSVERGRNWLVRDRMEICCCGLKIVLTFCLLLLQTSTDRDDARFLCPIDITDKIEEEPEFVLIDTKRDAAKEATCIEINDEPVGEDAPGNNRTDCENKIFKTDDDVEMMEPEENDSKPATVDEGDSDNEDAVAIKFEAEHAVPAQTEFDFRSDSDETVMSDTGDHNIAELENPANNKDNGSDDVNNARDGDLELKPARKADISDSESDDDNNASEVEGMVEVRKDGTIGDIDSDSDTEEEELKPSKDEEAGDGNDSDSESSEDEVELKPATHGDDDTVNDLDSDTSSDDDEEQELKSSKADTEDDSDSSDDEEEELKPSKGKIEDTFSDSSSEDEDALKPSTGTVDIISDSDSDSGEDQSSSKPIVHEVMSSSEDNGSESDDDPRAPLSQEDIFNQLGVETS